MLKLDKIKGNMNIKKSNVLEKMQKAGEERMYNYLSGIDPDSSYTNDNVKTILNMAGKLEWTKVKDPSNALFNIGYSEQGNIIGILTNANALLQDMLLYCLLDDAKENLKKVLSIEVGKNAIIGKRYAVGGKSPLTFSLPVVTLGGYKTLGVVIHNKHADEFIKIMETIDIDALTREDMVLIAKDISFISRTQELAIDVAKDKTIEIVDTSTWLNRGIKPKNYWLAKQKLASDGWYAKENLKDIINAKKTGDLLPKFEIISNIPGDVKAKVSREVTTSESIAREALKAATEDYFNNEFKSMLSYSQETELNITCKSLAIKYPDLAMAYKEVLSAYRSYMIDNIPRNPDDAETASLVRKIVKEKLDRMAELCRNTIYHIGVKAGYDYKTIAMVAYGTDLTEVSKDEGKYFRAIMPEEFKKLYAQGRTEKVRERLFFVDELVQDDIDDGELITIDFENGKAIKDDILIAKASYKFNAKNCLLVFDENDGQFYAEQELGINLPSYGNEILIKLSGVTDGQIDDINKSIIDELLYVPRTDFKSNVLLYFDKASQTYETFAQVGNYGIISFAQQACLINQEKFTNLIKNGKTETLKGLLVDSKEVKSYNLINKLKTNEIITVNKDDFNYRNDYLVFNI